MDISGINNSLINNTLNEAKRKESDNEFSKLLKDSSAGSDEKKLRKACKDFEGILLSMMYKEMRATVPKSSLLPDDEGKDIFQSMLDDQLTQEASKDGGMGLGDILYRQLSKGLGSSSEK